MKAFILFIFFTLPPDEGPTGIARYVMAGNYDTRQECEVSVLIKAQSLMEYFKDSPYNTMQFTCLNTTVEDSDKKEDVEM